MSATHLVAVIRGDGIGVDVTDAAMAVVDAAQRTIGGFSIAYEGIEAGALYYQETGRDISPGGEERAGNADAILLGAIGLPSVRASDGTEIAPHLRLRERYQLYAGIRPVKVYPNTGNRLSDPRGRRIDLVIVRESTEGLFYSAAVHNRSQVIDDVEVRETLRISRPTTEKLHDYAFKLARRRKNQGFRGKLTCVDKSNVFTAMAFFRKIFDERSAAFPDVEKDYAYVDAQALDLIRKPWESDVLVMENMFGDILSDLAGGLAGSMGMASCAEIGDDCGLFQPAHGSAPDIVGKDVANPFAAILSASLMLEYMAERSGNAKLAEAALLIEQATFRGFHEKRTIPIEFGGTLGTRGIAQELIGLIVDPRTREVTLRDV